jgi:1-phosphatidylinositol-4-phosphate 5-kinase
LAVHFGHENWNMVLSMMIGIRVSVGRVKHEVVRELQPVDFIMKEKFSIIPRLANIFDSAVSKRVAVTRFVDYAPLVFERIRAGFGIQHEEYLKSVGPEQLLGNMILGNLSSLSELSSEGKSGAFFYYTADGKYMMKTVSAKEHVLLKKMLHGYYQHIQQNPGTLICRFLGLHCLRIQKRHQRAGKSYRKSTQKLYFVVMGNMFNTPFDIKRRYDLKGSWVGRSTSPEDYDPSTALKDVDFTKASETIDVGPDRRTEIVAQIARDSEFLRGHNIIDYSLLLGICELCSASSEESSPRAHARAEIAMTHQPTFGAGQEGEGDVDGAGNHVSYGSEFDRADKVRSSVPVHKRDRGGMLSSDKKSLYFIGIIDILTPYDNAKRAETFVKALYNDSKGVSCCPPAMYSDRFVGFMRRAFV